MRRLPPLQTESPLEPQSQSWRLPLSDSTALRLAELMLCEGDDQRQSLLADLIAVDPALAVWLVGLQQAGGDDGRGPETICQLAHRFAGKLTDILSGSQQDSAAAGKNDRARWADLTARSLQVATLAKSLAQSDEPAADSAKAYFFGLLHAVTEWLERSTSDAVSAAQITDGVHPPRGDRLPGHLTDVLSRIASRSSEDPAVACVARAIRLLDESAECLAEERELLEATKKQVAPIAKSWARRSASAAEILPQLCRRLSRLSRLESQFADTLHTAKLDAMKELAYGAGHEINNPLANISTRAQTMLRDETDPQRCVMLATINRQAFRAHEMIADMMLFARPAEPQREPCDLPEIIRRVAGELQGEAARQGTTLSAEAAGEPLVVDADPRQLEVVVRAMCRNGLEAIGGGGRIDIRSRRVEQAERDQKNVQQMANRGDWIEIIIEDDGPGMDQREWEHLFDPFFSGREAGRGLGFGLSKCWRIVTAHGGRIEVEPRTVRGTRFRILLPRTAGENNGPVSRVL